MKHIVGEQLSLFGLKPTLKMHNESEDKIILDILELSNPPKVKIKE